jgi:hypothetical protein
LEFVANVTHPVVSAIKKIAPPVIKAMASPLREFAVHALQIVMNANKIFANNV